MKGVTAGLLTLALLAGAASMFVPWDQPAGAEELEGLYLWGFAIDGAFGTPFDLGGDDASARLWQLGALVGLTGFGVAALSTFASWVGGRQAAKVLAFVGGTLAGVGTSFFAFAVDIQAGGAEPFVGLYLGVGAVLLYLGGSIAASQWELDVAHAHQEQAVHHAA